MICCMIFKTRSIGVLVEHSGQIAVSNLNLHLSPVSLVRDDILRVCLRIVIHAHNLIACRYMGGRVEACRRLAQLAAIC